MYLNVSVVLTAYYILGDNEIIYSSLSYANMSHHIITVCKINASHKTYMIWLTDTVQLEN